MSRSPHRLQPPRRAVGRAAASLARLLIPAPGPGGGRASHRSAAGGRRPPCRHSCELDFEYYVSLIERRGNEVS